MIKKELENLAEMSKLVFNDEEYVELEGRFDVALQAVNNMTDNSANFIIEAAKTSSNLARIDGVRFSPSTAGETLDQLYKNTRTNAFDMDTKFKIMIGNYFIRGDNYEKYFKTAHKRIVKQETIGIGDLRTDEARPSSAINETMKAAPRSKDRYFVVPLVME